MPTPGFKQVRMYLEEEIYENLIKLKGETTWNDFMKEVVYSLTDAYVLAKLDETYMMVKEKTKKDKEKFEMSELNRIIAMNIFKGNYQVALKITKELEQRLESITMNNEYKGDVGKVIQDILNAKSETEEKKE